MDNFENPDIVIVNHLNLDETKLQVIHDPVFSSTIRFTIMMILNANRQAGFTKLRQLLKLTPGNIDHHIKTLNQAGYVEKSKSFTFKRFMTILAITNEGKAAYKKYADHLTELLGQAEKISFEK